MFSQLSRSTAIAFATAAVLAQTALATGEPKNEPPFTRPAGSRTPQAAVTRSNHTDPVIQGEPKNEPPFTRPATIIVASSHSLDWASSGIGAAAGFGVALVGVGGFALARKPPRSA